MAQKVSSLAIDINVTGAPQASQQLEKVEKSGRQLTDRLQKLTHNNADYVAGVALLGTTVALATKRMLEAAESYNRIGAKLAVVTDNLAQAKEVQDQLFAVAQETGAEFEALVGTYSRIALSAKELGVTQSQMVQVTANVAKSLQVSGASASEAAAGATQLAQALGSGKLAGDELKSILENAPVLARAIAAGLGVSVGQLREMGSSGKLLSTDVFGAILKQTGQIDSAFDKMGTSMERSSTRLANSFNRALGAIDAKIGASRRLSSLFDAISGAIDGTVGTATPAARQSATAEIRAQLEASRRRTTETDNFVARERAGLRNQPRPRRAAVGGGASPNERSTVDPRPGQLSGIRTGNIAAFGPNLPNIGEAIEAQSNAFVESVQPLLQTAQGLGASVVDSFANGITAAVQSGSLSEGFKEMGRTLLGGFGAQIRDFGIQSLGIAKLIGFLRGALQTMNPVGATIASLGLIAAGSAMVGLAGRGARASFGTTNTGINRGAATSSTITERGSIGLPSSIFGGAAPASGISGAVASAGNMVTVNATVIGPNDPQAQRQIAELVKRSAARGAV
jgi:tape measure domain-containing protein